ATWWFLARDARSVVATSADVVARGGGAPASRDAPLEANAPRAATATTAPAGPDGTPAFAEASLRVHGRVLERDRAPVAHAEERRCAGASYFAAENRFDSRRCDSAWSTWWSGTRRRIRSVDSRSRVRKPGP